MYRQVIDFWFSELEPRQWWEKDGHLDNLIRERFLLLHEQAIRCELFPWRENAFGRLAEIIVLDQFSRNMFRDSPDAFSADGLALVLAQEAVSSGADMNLNQGQRNFLYMPYMHSESLVVHDVAIELFRKNGSASALDYELKHKKIIEMFGRYPHRNDILGRENQPRKKKRSSDCPLRVFSEKEDYGSTE